MSRTQQSQFKLSRRVSNVDLQRGRTRLKVKAREMKNEGIDIVDMSGYVIERPYGEFKAPPDYVIDAVKKALDDGWPDPSPRGITSFRELVAKTHSGLAHIDIDPNKEVLVTGGGSMQGLYNAIQAIIDPGDEVLIFRPGLPYDEIVKLAEGVPIYIDLATEDGYVFDSRRVENAITKRTKMIILNTPHNPTGHVASEKEVKEIAECAMDHDLIVISDEVLWNWVYDNRTHISIASISGMRDRTIIVNSLTKSGLFDWRVGWVVANERVVERLEKIMFWQNQFSSPLLQVASQAHLSRLTDWIAPIIQQQQNKRDFVCAALEAMDLACFKPEGAIMTFPTIDKFEQDSTKFAERILVEGHVFVSPGESYLGEGHLRIGYGNNIERMKEGMSRMSKVLGKMG